MTDLLVSIGIDVAFTAIGAGVGYKATGTVRGTILGGVVGLELGLIATLTPENIPRAIIYGFLGFLTSAAKQFAASPTQPPSRSTFNEEIIKSLAISEGLVLAQAGGRQIAAKFLNNYADGTGVQVLYSAFNSAITNSLAYVADGSWKKDPEGTLRKVGESFLTTAVAQGLGLDAVTASTLGTVVPRAVEAFYGFVKTIKNVFA